MPFDEWARIQRIPGPENHLRFRLLRDLMYRSRSGKVFFVPAGFASDLGSVPRLFWFLAPPHEYPSAYILHDYCCETPEIPRQTGDQLLHEALQASNCPRWKVHLIYTAVRLYAIINRLK